MHCIGKFGSSCEFWRRSLEKPTEIHHNSGVSAVCTNYDGCLWVFPRKVVRIRMNSRNSLYKAPAKKVSKYYVPKTKNPVQKGLHYSNLFPQRTERRTVTVTKCLVVSKEGTVPIVTLQQLIPPGIVCCKAYCNNNYQEYISPKQTNVFDYSVPHGNSSWVGNAKST